MVCRWLKLEGKMALSGRVRQSGVGIVQAVTTVVLLILSFSLGYVVGKRGSDRTASTAPKSIEEILRLELAKRKDVIGEQELQFYDTLVNKKTAAQRQPSVAVPPKNTKAEKKAPVAIEVAKATRNKQAAAPKAQQKSPTAQKTSSEPAPKTSAVAPSKQTAAAPYSVQVGSFREESQAKTLVSELARQQVQGRVKRVDLGQKGTWWRVLVGHYANADEAATAGSGIRQRTGKSYLVTRVN